MEGVLGVIRLGERADHVQELDHRARPSVGEDERPRAVMRRPHVKEVDTEPIDLGTELRVGVEPFGKPVHVVVGGPIVSEFTDIAQRYALRPVRHRLGIGPACPRQTVTQVVDLGIGDSHTELTHGNHFPDATESRHDPVDNQRPGNRFAQPPAAVESSERRL